jgi:hypothetical protein
VEEGSSKCLAVRPCLLGNGVKLLDHQQNQTLSWSCPLLHGGRYNQGSGRLTMLLNAMAAHGTIIKEGDAFRYKSRTPTPERKPSPTASRGYAGGCEACLMGAQLHVRCALYHAR